ncbi:MAG: hypothetical protein QOC82_3340 [Frankiaceae bacterium]|jgi:nitroreductase|nr:hypothetical protein [Frankiaceae bacterium]MDQ1698738.1 hypothetical protein [Frankiaceae bacterium]
MTTTTIPTDPLPLTTANAVWAVEQACRAPSLHNTQPWRFTFGGNRFDLYADTSRALAITDPDARELVLSCGAALYNLRVALRKLGYHGTATLLPDRSNPRLLASVAVSESIPASAAERREYAALLRRHTHRGPFEPRALTPELAARLQQAADEEIGQLIYVHDPGQRRRVLQLARAAVRGQQADQRVAAELAAWTPPPEAPRRDGVPASAYSSDPPVSPDDLPPRDFDQSRGFGRLVAHDATPGTLAVLATGSDLQPDWLRAGQALERVLLTAAEQWAFAALHSPITEVSNLRSELRRELCTSAHPQILLRFGYAPDATATPRRPVNDVLELR